MQLSAPLLLTALTLGLSSLTHAVCTGQAIAIGTATTVTTGFTTWKIYDTACNVVNTYTQSSAVTLCDSRVFQCKFGTALIGQYDDPVTGWAYNATADTVVERCGADIVISCVSDCSVLLIFLCLQTET